MSTVSTPIYDRVSQTSTTTGTGTLTLDGTVTAQQTFGAVGNGNRCIICIEALDGNGDRTGPWEVCASVYTASGTTLTRGRLKSSSTGSRVNFTSGHLLVSYVADAATLQPRTWNFVEDFDADPSFVSDNCQILTDALNTIADLGGGTLYVPPGRYKFSAGLSDTGGTGHANAQIVLPQFVADSTTEQPSIRIQGATSPLSSGESAPLTGRAYSIFCSTLQADGNFMSSLAGDRNGLHLSMDNIVLELPKNPQLTGFQFGYQVDIDVDHLLIYQGVFKFSEIEEPTHTTQTGLVLPINYLPAFTRAKAVVAGMYTGVQLGELLVDGQFTCQSCKQGMRTTQAWHANLITFLGLYECHKGIVGDDAATKLRITLLDYEQSTAAANYVPAWMQSDQAGYANVYDPSNLIYGDATWEISQDSSYYHTMVVTGGANFVLNEIGT